MTADHDDSDIRAGLREQDEQRALLLDRIRRRRAIIDAYVRRERPRSARLTMVGVVGSALSAVLVAGPAVGGESFSSAAQKILGLPKESVVWQILCLVALVVSVVAAIATNLQRSDDLVARVSSGEAALIELEGLATMVSLGTIDAGTAVQLYQRSAATVSFVGDDEP